MNYLPSITSRLASTAPVTSGSSEIRGSAAFFSSQTWVVPEGVKSICIVCIGGGGGGGVGPPKNDRALGSGGAGGLAYANNIPVKKGQTVSITVGRGGTAGWPHSDDTAYGVNGESTSVVIDSVTVCEASGGTGGGGNGWSGSSSAGVGGAMIVGDGGSSGGNGVNYNDSLVTNGNAQTVHGGGTAGYLGGGANGYRDDNVTSSLVTGTLDGGGSGRTVYIGGAVYFHSGEGVGIYGAYSGSPDTSLTGAANANEVFRHANAYGSGGSALYHYGEQSASSENEVDVKVTGGGPGVARILWGKGRSFPETDVGYD